MKLLNGSREQRSRRRRDPRSGGAHDVRRAGRGAVGPGRRPDDARGGARGDLVADAPRAARAHVLEVPLARDARAHPRRLHADRARGRADRAPVRAPALPRARVLHGRDPRHRALADPQRDPRRARGPRGRRLPRDRGPAPPGRRAGPRDAARRGRDRVVLSRDRVPDRALGLRQHAVAHPRARHARVPALARQARPGGVGGRPLRRARGRTSRRPPPSTWATRPWPVSAPLAGALAVAFALVMRRLR